MKGELFTGIELEREENLLRTRLGWRSKFVGGRIRFILEKNLSAARKLISQP
jgi:hypothetical protein